MSYIKSIVDRHKSKEINPFNQLLYIDPLIKNLEYWANRYLQSISYSGSYAKGTSINLGSDLDLFVSLKSDTDFTLKEIYESLYAFLITKYSNVRQQNVSIRVVTGEYEIDIVPAKNDKGNTNYHKLYTRRKDSWIQTNVTNHINIVRNSNRTVEISALKIWRKNHSIHFPSIYLELVVIEALKGKKIGDYDTNVWSVFYFLRDNIESIKIIDPSNTNNIISDTLNASERKIIKSKAIDTINQKDWRNILW